jgi:signal peptidase I
MNKMAVRSLLALVQHSMTRVRSAALHGTGRRVRVLGGAGLALIAAGLFMPWRGGLVVGRSMEPTLPHGTVFLYDHQYYRNHPVQSGDIVVLRENGTTWIKRVYAPGGTGFWALREEVAGTIKRQPIRESQSVRFAKVASHLRDTMGAKMRVTRVRVPTGCVFVMGDGVVSVDSRQLGPFQASEILGRVVELPGQHFGPIPSWVVMSFPERRGLDSGAHGGVS